MKGERETLGGAVEQIFGSHLTLALLIPRRRALYHVPISRPAPTDRTPSHFRCTVYRFPTPLAGLPSHLLFGRCSLTVSSTFTYLPRRQRRIVRQEHSTYVLSAP